jgi:hypothetical protein
MAHKGWTFCSIYMYTSGLSVFEHEDCCHLHIFIGSRKNNVTWNSIQTKTGYDHVSLFFRLTNLKEKNKMVQLFKEGDHHKQLVQIGRNFACAVWEAVRKLYQM